MHHLVVSVIIIIIIINISPGVCVGGGMDGRVCRILQGHQAERNMCSECALPRLAPFHISLMMIPMKDGGGVCCGLWL